MVLSVRLDPQSLNRRLLDLSVPSDPLGLAQWKLDLLAR